MKKYTSDANTYLFLAKVVALIIPGILNLILIEHLRESKYYYLAFIVIMLMIVGLSESFRSYRMLQYDGIIKIDNWNNFINKATKKVQKNPSGTYAMVSLDLVRFRNVNKLDSDERGDWLLTQIAQVLAGFVKKGELFGRYQADQFNLLMYYTSKEECSNRLIELNKHLEALSENQNLRFTFGVYVIERKEITINRANDYSSMARLSNKKRFNEKIYYFDQNKVDTIERELAIENHMEEALSNGEFIVYYQPKYSLESNSITGAEALVRWKNSNNEMILPGEFIPLFERNGFVVKLDYYVIEKVCQKLRKWKENNIPMLRISVNMSRIHLFNPDLVKEIKEIVDRYEIPYHYIELELTESVLFDDKITLINTIKKLRDIGFCVSMDDFGAGYSTLNLLKDLSIDTVKLDGDLFRIIDKESKGQIIVRDIIAMIQHLRLNIVAEGIETIEQVHFLKETRCDSVQGYYFARPMPEEQLEQLLFPC